MRSSGSDPPGASPLHLCVPDSSSPPDVEGDEELHRAFEAGELVLYYQPKIELSTDRTVGVEALLRWRHPTRGIVTPIEFIGVAERSGIIVPIGTWAIEEGCRQVARWREVFPDRPALVVSVNVSGRQFSRQLVDVVEAALSASAIEAGTLCLEITESTLMDDPEDAVAILGLLADLGVNLSIDDFGTGFSSLARLRSFPVDELKIDKAFIDDVGDDTDATAIVASVIAMGHALKLRIVAEGVETAGQLERLRHLGCDEVQGYHLARPAPASVVEQLLKDEGRASWRQHAEQAPEPRPGEPTYRPERVLVVDDSADVRELVVMTLTAVGFEAHEAVDGTSALSAARLLAPDCVLLDVVLPDLSGLEVCRALRADPATADCTILVLSLVAEAATKAQAFAHGADDYIVKPFSPRDLASRVHSAMRCRRDHPLTVDQTTATVGHAVLVPIDEAARLDAVRRYDILDTPPDGAFDRITALAARLFDVPIAIVSIVDADRIWLKSHHGLPDVEQIGRDPGLCASAILQHLPWVITDAARDPRTLANPLVAGDLGLRFYAGAPLTTADGHNLGTLCVIDREPRQITAFETASLVDLAALVMDQLELRLAARRAVEALMTTPGG